MATLLDRMTKALSGWLKRSLPQRTTGCAPDPARECKYDSFNRYVCRKCYYSPTCELKCSDWEPAVP